MNRISRSRAGDGEAFAALFHQYKNLVYRTAYLMLGNTQEAEDALQEVFLSVHRALGTFDSSRAAFTTWLYRITVNHCLNLQRESGPPSVSLGETPGHLPSPEGQVMEDQALQQALASLSDKQRAVIVLRYYADLTYAEIGETLEVPLGTVKSRLNQALGSLRRYFQINSEDAAPVGVSHGKEVAE